MKQIINFKKNIFKKKETAFFAIPYKITKSTKALTSIKNDLIKILNNFGEFKSKEIILLHKDLLPPKTKRCAMEIMTIDKSITHSTNKFINYDSDNIILHILLNFKKEKMQIYINYIDSLIQLVELINKKNCSIKILKNKINDYPQWLMKCFQANNLQKMKTIKFIVAIQNYYKKMFIPYHKIILKGDLILSFSSKETKDEYLQKNNYPLLILNKQKYNNNKKNNEIIINTNHIKNLDNVIKYTKNYSINLIKNEANKTNELFNMSLVTKDAPTIGILDGAISKTSPFRNLIKVTSYLNNHIPQGHGEAVASIAFAGDELNNFDDGCDKFNIHLFEIFEEGLVVTEWIKRIEIAIKSKYQEIRVWNLSSNATDEDAFDNGEITWMAKELDRIQDEYNVIIIQSSGNKKPHSSQKIILSPSDSIKSLVVNAIASQKNNQPTNYSLDGHYEYFTRKPDVAYFGGSNKEPVIFLIDGKIASGIGTSYAAPFIARKMAQLIYYENKIILEAKALIIHASYMNSNSSSIKNGWGVVPHNIKDILKTNNHSIRFIFNENISDTRTVFMELNIPQNDIQKYSVYITTLCSEIFDEQFGCEYLRSSIDVGIGPIKYDPNKNDFKLVPYRKVKPHEIETLEGEPLTREKQLIKFYGKWKSVNCAKDVVKRIRGGIDSQKYGITAKINKRMNVIDKKINHKLICIVTLVHKDEEDKYDKFILKNKNNITTSIKNEFPGIIKLQN